MAILWREPTVYKMHCRILPHILSRFLVGNQPGINMYKLESQRCIKSSSRSKGMFLAQNTGFIPHCRYIIKWRPETHFISAKDVHFIVSYTWGMFFFMFEATCKKKWKFEPSASFLQSSHRIMFLEEAWSWLQVWTLCVCVHITMRIGMHDLYCGRPFETRLFPWAKSIINSGGRGVTENSRLQWRA